LPNAVKRIWPGETVVCIASGPSLTKEDCEFVRGKAKVIVINTSYQLAKWADVLYACDGRWWRWNKGAKDFNPNGLKFALERRAGQMYPEVKVLRTGKPTGLSLDPMYLNTGKNSGYQAINLAVLMGASKIVLLGYDMQRGSNGDMHWHNEHPIRTPHLYREFRERYQTLVEPLKAAGVEIVNCSRQTALECFPRMPLEQAFPLEQAA
jgi:hypothetical protein